MPVVVPGNSLVHAFNSNMTDFQKGMSYATYAFENISDQYERPESDKSLESMKRVGIEWVAINVVWYQEKFYSPTIYPDYEKYSPTNKSVEHAINKAHKLGMKVMLKPKIDCNEGWSGYIVPSVDWFSNYTSFIVFFAEMAEKHNVELFCIGCELMSIEWNVSWYNSWQNVVSSVRTHYSGNVTYASTAGMLKYPESYRWWDNIDYIGINAYYTLNLTANDFDPSIDELKLGWSQPIQEIEEWRSNKNISKPIIFTEIGYQAVNGTHTRPWDYTLMNKTEFELDLQEQADCYEAAFLALENKTETWFKGMYWWYWQTDPNPTDPARGSDAVTMVLRDYTPQNKPAQGVLTHWYNVVIPELPSALVLPLFMTATLLVAIVYKRKHAI
jgi:hypothetical protein